MIRRFYVMPLDRRATRPQVDQLLTALGEADRFIPGLVDSYAAEDADSRTVMWEMAFRDEDAYVGPYMVHPYHIATIDSYLLGDSPERLCHDFAAMRYRVPDDAVRLEQGVRRVLLMNAADGSDTSMLQELADRGTGTAASVLATDDIGWRSSKGSRGLTWSHVWEQTFADQQALDAYLATAEGVACSDRDGLRRLGADVKSLQVLTYPFVLEPSRQDPALPLTDEPFLYVITARLGLPDVDAYVRLLEQEYDASLGRAGASLLSRVRSVEGGYLEAEVQSTWRFESMVAFKDFRSAMPTDPSWNRFVLEAMPLLRGGTRRLYRTV